MSDTIKSLTGSIRWHKKYSLRAPKKGSIAPDFELFDVMGENLVRLSAFRGDKPVVLVFGSFT